jgi:hypothetical protein
MSAFLGAADFLVLRRVFAAALLPIPGVAAATLASGAAIPAIAFSRNTNMAAELGILSFFLPNMAAAWRRSQGNFY